MKIRVFISGRVQGVFFRAHMKERADSLGLSGWVRNLPDGRVEAIFEGGKEKIEEMVEWCWQGSPGSKVERVEKIEEVGPRKDFLSFSPALKLRKSTGFKKRLDGFEIIH